MQRRCRHQPYNIFTLWAMNDMKRHEVFGMMEAFLDGGLPRRVTILDGGVSPKGNFLP